MRLGTQFVGGVSFMLGSKRLQKHFQEKIWRGLQQTALSGVGGLNCLYCAAWFWTRS